MIYDCFNIYNEVEILLLRLDYLFDVVDYFVIVESLDSHSKKVRKSSYMFEDNIELYRKYLSKIRYYKIDNLPFDGDTGEGMEQKWPNENFQKNCCALGLYDAKPDDWIIFSDVDEIPRKEYIQKLRAQEFNQYYLVQFHQYLFYYFVNVLQSQIWSGSVATQYKNFDSMMFLRMHRNSVHPSIIGLPNGGWHYSYMGGATRVLDKMTAYAEANANASYRSLENIKECIETRNDLLKRDHPIFKKQLIPIEFPLINSEDFSKPLLAPNNLPRIISQFPDLFCWDLVS